jgi:hypothetical protein
VLGNLLERVASGDEEQANETPNIVGTTELEARPWI